MLQLEQLNDAQRKAVMHGEGPLLVLAGPGSGKTFTITQRIIYLIEEMHVSPEEILVITFTKEAASSMQHRFQNQSDYFLPVNFGTFHSVFFHILNQSDASIHSKIMRETQKRNLLYPILNSYLTEQNMSQQNTGIGYSGTMNRSKESLAEDAAMILSAISLYKNTGSAEMAAQNLNLKWKESFPKILSAYENSRKKNCMIDFDDMVYECAELLTKNMGVREYWQGRFTHILMDEFQDINPMQYRVIGLLAKSPYNLFAVGDDDQAIYGFRGSSPACLMQFASDYHAKQVLLNINYRSHKEIVRASSLVIAQNRERFPKEIVSKECGREIAEPDTENPSVKIHTFAEREEQYHYLTQMLSQKKSADTCAVLFRTNSYMQGFAARLQREGIDFSMKEKVTSIYEQKAAKDIMAYLLLASGQKKKELWLRIINKPSRYISREVFAGSADEISLADIKEYYHRIGQDNAAYAYVDKIRSAIRILEKQLQYLKNATPFLAVQYVRRVIGYEKNCKTDGKELEILEWLSEDAKNYHTIEEWLEAQKQYTNMLEKRDVRFAADGQQEKTIQLMTVHASKGLEFDNVWIPDCNEKVFPYGRLPDKEACEEERRIFYVAMTRAKKNLELLGLTGTKERPRFLSRFLNPLWKEYS